MCYDVCVDAVLRLLGVFHDVLHGDVRCAMMTCRGKDVKS